MPNQSLSVMRLSSNDTSSLAEIYETMLNGFYESSNPYEKKFLRQLRTIAGLGYAASLVNWDLHQMYQLRLNIFLDHFENKFSKEAIAIFSQTIAEMISLASNLFKMTGYPGYYHEFIHSVKKTLCVAQIELIGKQKEAERILLLLLKKG